MYLSILQINIKQDTLLSRTFCDKKWKWFRYIFRNFHTTLIEFQEKARNSTGVLFSNGVLVFTKLEIERFYFTGAANLRERTRMRVLSKAFGKLKLMLPWVPPDTKLSKLDTLRLATSYISHLQKILDENGSNSGDFNENAENAPKTFVNTSLVSTNCQPLIKLGTTDPKFHKITRIIKWAVNKWLVANVWKWRVS